MLDTTIISPENYEWNFNFSSFIVLLGIIIVWIPIQTSAENTFLEAYLMQGIGYNSGTRWLPLIVYHQCIWFNALCKSRS